MNSTVSPRRWSSSASARQRITCPTPRAGPTSHRTPTRLTAQTVSKWVEAVPNRAAIVSERQPLPSVRRSLLVVSILTGSDILVTGGTGSFGRAFVQHALERLNPRRIIVFSRDEL